jgi:hypothetical protein
VGHREHLSARSANRSDESAAVAVAPLDPNVAQMIEPLSTLPVKRSKRRLVGASVLVAVAAGAFGFAVTHRNSGPKVVTIAQAAELTKAQTSARIAMTMNFPIPGIDDKPIDATGEFDFTTQLIRVDVDLTDLLANQMPADMPADALKLTIIGSGLHAYERFPALDSEPKFAGKWVSFDIGAVLKSAAGVDLSKMPGSASFDPSATLDQIRAAADTTESVGPDLVRGVRTTHYRSTMSLEKMYRSNDAVADEVGFQRLLSQFSSPTTTADVWIDNDGLIRRITYEIPLKAKASTINLEFFDFGVKTDIAIPAPEDTVDFAELTAKA